jgi:hypothetical protein
MKIACLCLLLLAAASPLRAQEGDPLKSQACGAALAQLQAARGADSASPAAVESLRSAAATTCLGSGAPPSRPGRVLQAPVVVPPPQIEVPQQVAPLAPPVLPPPPVIVGRPAAPALCDAGGCWADDGTHLLQVPPTLAGPRGLCTQRAGQLFCP